MHNGGMFLRSTRRLKDGKEHRYWSIVENRRGTSGRVIQRQVLYLGEVNDSQQAAWCRCLEVFESARAVSGAKWCFSRRTGRRPSGGTKRFTFVWTKCKFGGRGSGERVG